MRAPEQRWQTEQQLLADDPGYRSPREPHRPDVSSLLDQAKAGLKPLGEYLDDHAARSAPAAGASVRSAAAGFQGARPAAAGAGHSADAEGEQWRPATEPQAPTEPPPRSADAALLATPGTYPHSGGGVVAQEQHQGYGIAHSLSAPDLNEPATRSQVLTVPAAAKTNPLASQWMLACPQRRGAPFAAACAPKQRPRASLWIHRSPPWQCRTGATAGERQSAAHPAAPAAACSGCSGSVTATCATPAASQWPRTRACSTTTGGRCCCAVVDWRLAFLSSRRLATLLTSTDRFRSVSFLRLPASHSRDDLKVPNST